MEIPRKKRERGVRRNETGKRYDGTRTETRQNEWPGAPGTISDEHQERVRNPANGRWCKLVYEFFSIMDSDEVVLVCFLLHHHDVCLENLPKRHREAGWFWCTAATVEQRIGWDGAKQRRVLKKLVDKGYIEREQHRKRNPKGVPTGQPVRWLRINTTKLVADSDAAFNEMWAKFDAEDSAEP